MFNVGLFSTWRQEQKVYHLLPPHGWHDDHLWAPTKVRKYNQNDFNDIPKLLQISQGWRRLHRSKYLRCLQLLGPHNLITTMFHWFRCNSPDSVIACETSHPTPFHYISVVPLRYIVHCMYIINSKFTLVSGKRDKQEYIVLCHITG